MANIGLKKFLHAPIKEDGTYDEVGRLAGAIAFAEALDTADVPLYVDDTLQERDTSVSGGTVTLGVDDDDDTIFAPLLGKTAEELTVGEKKITVYTSNTGDVPTGFGFGYISKKTGGKYKVSFYPKIQFRPYSLDLRTKEESIEYVTPSVEGTIFPLESGVYKKETTVDDEETAVAVLYAFFGATVPETA